MKDIFLVEDEENIRNLIAYSLESKGYTVKAFESGQGLFKEIAQQQPSLIILDIMLPGEDGFTILSRLRRELLSSIPVIILTAKTSEYHRVKGLDMGADDYILKPFSLMELLSRVKAVLRRYQGAQKLESVSLTAGPLKLLVDRHEILLDERSLDLTFKEFQLLEYLIRNKNLVLTRNMIMEEIWGYDYSGESRTIDVHIRSLRQKLGSYDYLIETIRNLGYKLGV